MNNKKKIKFILFLSIISNTIAISLLIIGVVMLFNSDKPSVLNESEFREYMSDIGCEIIDGTEFRKDETIDTYLTTNKETCPYIFTYIKFNNNEKLYGYYNMYVNYVLKNNHNVKETYKTNINLHYEYYNYTTIGDYYKSAILNQHSILYASSNAKYKNKIIDTIENLGYHIEIDELVIKICAIAGMIFELIIIIFMYGIEKKIRNKGWVALIPFYNVGCLFKDIFGSGFYALLLFVPIVNIIYIFKLLYKVGVALSQSKAKCILLMLFPTLFGPLVAFDDSIYSNNKNINI